MVGSMNLDPHTLFVVTISVDAMLGMLLLFAWFQNAQIRAVAWWGAALFLRAVAVALFGLRGGAVPEIISVHLATTLLLTTFGLTWCGARVFDGRKPRLVSLVAGAAVWLVVSRMPVFAQSPDLRALLSSGFIAAYTWLAAYEFWKGRPEPLVSRWPIVFVLFTHGALFLLHTPLAALLPWSPAGEIFATAWLTVLSFEALLFTIAIAFILLAMAKERTELLHKTASLVDPLTGIANRRAFLTRAGEGTRSVSATAGAAAVLPVDLDNFKSINDRFGHALGDRVLLIFAEIACAHIRPAELLGRIGGDEFAAVLHRVDRAAALRVAERIRVAFAAAAGEVEGFAVGGTISIGVALAEDVPVEISVLLAQADQALYHAKGQGRNRVELASLDIIRRRRDEGTGVASKRPNLAAQDAA